MSVAEQATSGDIAPGNSVNNQEIGNLINVPDGLIPQEKAMSTSQDENKPTDSQTSIDELGKSLKHDDDS
ncbi:hypothetical protein NPX13_g1415 [Xylaria arbuscula]|uniref:Uncharacterized protein n=1 Tax=Xylaria arbuscula TaxID=114810 RepID=A0A9W8NL38_9PEZI|nr:hypothetical protein NPX13_g1415 [Xylaria arbuscula]